MLLSLVPAAATIIATFIVKNLETSTLLLRFIIVYVGFIVHP